MLMYYKKSVELGFQRGGGKNIYESGPFISLLLQDTTVFCQRCSAPSENGNKKPWGHVYNLILQKGEFNWTKNKN